ncbi:MAG: AMP-dependent synthetase/ligase [Alphaproteobacteria bacterium]
MYQPKKTLPQAFFKRVHDIPNQALFHDKRQGQWQATTCEGAKTQVLKLAAFLQHHGVCAGDRVAIVAENSTRWALCDLAIMSLGAIVVPSYTTSTSADHAHVFNHSGAKLALVGGGKLFKTVLQALQDCTSRPLLCSIEDDISREDYEQTVGCWKDIDSQKPLENIDRDLDKLSPTDVCCFIYTSGTGGVPKAVMLTHASIQANIDAAIDLLAEGGITHGQRFLSLLPLSHSYEHTAGLHLPIQTNSEVWYCESREHIARDLQETSPTLMTAVPRLYEVLHDRIMRGVKAKGGLSAKLFMSALKLGRKRLDTQPLSWVETFYDQLLDVLVRKKVKARLGGRLQYFVSGGAPLNPEIGYFFMSLGVQILQGYGQTEASPLISANRPGKIKVASVGPPVKGVELKIAEDGEILARGDMVMQGYWSDKEATAETIQDGWLYTGDIGHIDPDGYLYITGRKKDMIVNSGGDNIAPSKIEQMLTFQPLIAQAMVFGDKRPWLSAVLVPHREGENTEIREEEKALAEQVAQVNNELPAHERVRRFIVADEPFSVENGEMTATLKGRRHVVWARYSEALESLYHR